MHYWYNITIKAEQFSVRLFYEIEVNFNIKTIHVNLASQISTLNYENNT
jgi:hypothetical protein